MSTEIEQRVVEMQFDNKQFERNVSNTMSSLDKLKQSLNLSGAAKGLESVGTAAKGINLSGLTSAAETVGLKFNAMYTIADQALRNITNSAVNAGKRIASALTIDPIKTGFSEYETQINAVQTILANTESKGTTLNDVNTALDTLNAYADKTIYNFTEMTRNIGTFTAAGVDLDTSVTAIQGIANLAAVSGSTSQQASTAMYQLSQALSSGTVKLMDWNSVVNAGMGGQVFQDALKETARVHGIAIDEMIEEHGSFRETLSEGWLSSEILTETLSKFTMATEGLTEAQIAENREMLKSKGYTDEQIDAIFKLGDTATNAATKVKTFTQLWDTLKEAAQSGWTQTWEIIVGDFEEAKELLTKVSDVIGKMIGDSANARNELLKGWKDAGGRNDLIEGISSAFEGIMNIVKPIKEAFRNIFPPTTVDQLVGFTAGFKDLMQRFEDFTASHGDQIRTTFEGIFSVIDIGWTFVKKLAGGIKDLFSNFSGLGEGILGTTTSIGEWLNGLRNTVKETDIFGIAIDKVVGFLTKVIDKIKGFGRSINTAFESPGLERFYDIMSGIWNFIVKIGSKLGEIFAPLGQAVSNVFNNASFSDVLNDGIFAGILVGIYKFVDNLNGPLGSLKDLFDGIAGEDGIIGGLKDTLDSVRGCFEAYQNSLQADTIKKIAVAIAILAAAIFVISSIDGDKLDHSLGVIGILFAELIGAFAIFNKLNSNQKGLLKGTAAITGLASALLILSAAMKIMSSMSWNEIAIGLTGTVVGLGALVAAVNLLPEKKVTKSAKAIGKLATAVVILAAGMKIMATMSWKELGVAIVGVVGGLGALVAAVNLLPKDAALRSLGMLGLATAMVILGGALKIIATMSWEEIARGLVAMAGALAEIAIAMNFMTTALPGAAAMLVLAPALVILTGALKIMASMSWEEIGKGLVALAGSMLILAGAMALMTTALPGAAAMLVIAPALAILAATLKMMGSMSWEEIGKGLLALAGALAVIGVAGLLLTPVIPALLGLSAALLMLGLATVGLGAGLALIGAGITALSTSLAVGSTAIVAGLAAIIGGIVDLIPTVVLGLGDGILALCTVIKECAPAIVETLFVLLAEVCTSIATYTPVIADALFVLLIGALNVLAERMPELIQAAMDVIGAFFTGIVDALKGIDTSSLIEGIVGAGLLAALMAGLSLLTPMIPSALAAVLGMGVFIAELALMLAAVGALAQIPGLKWLIGEGGDLLQQIGVALGKFVGGIIGGIAEGATSTLPQVGTNLSDFMTNLQPFITGMQSLDTSMLDNATALASAILTLTAADLLSGIASFFKGGKTLADFGTEIAEFGKSMKNYSSEVSGIDVAAIDTSIRAAKDLVKMAGEIPSDGLFGTDGIDDFGKNIIKFGKCIKQYGAEVAEIDTEAITTSVSAAKGLVSVANQIPDDGTFGTDGIDDFGKNIVKFGKSIKQYGEHIAEVSVDAIDKSVSVVRSLIRVINSMVGMDTSGVDTFKKAVKDLSKVNFDGFVETFTKSTANLTNVGKNMFNSIIEGIKSTKTKFVEVAREMIDVADKAIDGKGGQFKASGIEIISKFINGVISAKSRVSSAFTSALSTALSAIKEYQSKFHSAGAYLVSGFANGISANRYKAAAQAKAMASAAANAARRELDEHSPSKVGYEIGDFFGVAFVNAIADNTKRAYDASMDLANSAKTGLKGAFDKVNRLISGEVDVNPTIRPVLDLSNVKSGANAINGMLGLTPSVGVLANVGAVSSMMNQRSQAASNDDIIYAINKLQKALGNVGNTTNIIEGVTYDDGSNVHNTVAELIRAIKMEGRA